MNKLATSIFAASAIAVSGSFCTAFAQAGSGTPPDTPVLMVGDSMMRLLGVAMEKQCKKAGIQPAVSFSSLGSGLVRPNVFDWNAKIDELARAYFNALYEKWINNVKIEVNEALWNAM